LGEYLHHIYPNDRLSSYFDHHIIIDNRGRLKTKLYDKRDDFTFPTVNSPFIGSNIPASSAYGIDNSQHVHFSRAFARTVISGQSLAADAKATHTRLRCS